MSRELLIMRHAESGWSGVSSDFERTLTERGGNDALRMGEWMRGEGLHPDYILASPAQRAKETVRAVCGALEIDEQQIHWEPRIYEAEVEMLLQLLQQLPQKASRILMVGHNPGLAEIVQLLTDSYAHRISPAIVVQLETPSADVVLDKGCASLQRLIAPSEL